MNAAPDQDARERATDTSRSVIVQAPAGSGKTSLLVRRYLKLLALVEQPEEVLAITFTRKAAGEMANRVFDALQAAAAADGGPVGAEAAEASRALARGREKGWRLLEQPARLKVQTIDSLAMGLTRGLPVAAGLDPDLHLTETADGLYREAATRHLLRLYDDGPLTADIADFLAQCGNDANRAERLLARMLGKRDQWLDVIHSVVATHQAAPERVAEVLEAALRALNDNVISGFRDSIGERHGEELDELLDHAARVLGRDVTAPHDRYHLAAEVLTTQRGGFRRQIDRRNGFGTGDPELKARMLALIDALDALDVVEQVTSLRYLPNPELSPEAVQRLVKVSINLALLNAELAATFAASGFTDFTTLILNARAALGDPQAPTELALALDYRIHHLLVDEFQDTSVSQFRLFERLIAGWTGADGNTFFAVGDPMQSIYRFRDAEVSLFYRAWQHGIAGIPLDRVVLTSNFRADARLVDWVNDAFGRILGSGQDPTLGRIAYRPAEATLAAADRQPAVTLRRYPTASTQASGIVTTIEGLLADTEGSIALLVRNRGHLTEVIRLLRERGIDWHANDIDPLLNKPAVRDLLTLVSVLDDTWNRLAWFSLLRAPFVGLTLADLQVLAETEDFPALLESALEGRYPPLSPSGRLRLGKLAGAWSHCGRLLHEVPPRSVVETLWVRLGGADAYADPNALLHATRFLELLETAGAPGLAPELLGQAAANLFAADLTESRLQILTIHKAKGLEFDHVLVPFLERIPRHDDAELLLWRALPEGLLMGVQDDEGPYAWLARENRLRDSYERQRLFYVACTRARRSLTLFATDVSPPRETSLLALLAPIAARGSTDTMQVVDVPAETDARQPWQPDLFTEPDDSHGFRRLTDDYRWTPSTTGLQAYRPVPTLAATPYPANDPLTAREEVALGIVVHAALERLARASLPLDADLYVEAQEPLWRRYAGALTTSNGQTLSATAAARVAADAARQIGAVLKDADGRWLLEARESAQAEFRITVLEDGNAENLVIDRTFVENGVRWLVDYKTSIRPAAKDEADFLGSEVRRYRLQLERYADAMQGIYGERPRLAIYFTSVPRLVVLDP